VPFIVQRNRAKYYWPGAGRAIVTLDLEHTQPRALNDINIEHVLSRDTMRNKYKRHRCSQRENAKPVLNRTTSTYGIHDYSLELAGYWQDQKSPPDLTAGTARSR
jgi:hypothetical protein